jgi:DNA-binding XRE family transcriptional regulator
MSLWQHKWSEARRISGLTQQKAADQIGLSLSTIQKWEQGHRQPSLAYQPMILRLLRK